MKYNKTFFVMLRWCVGMVVGGFFALGVSEASAQVQVDGSVFGGGNNADVTGNTSVRMQDNVTVTGNVYGGGAFASTGTLDQNNTTLVTIVGGTVGGDVFGGALGDANHEPNVNGAVTVNIGELTDALSGGFAPSGSVSGTATIGGRIFGCNNAAGTPKKDVTVNIYKTAHPAGTLTSETGFAIDSVFGGGNMANYLPVQNSNKTTVHVWTCDNTIQKVYGGGNAADVGGTITSATHVIIDGGHIEWVFGGGNGAGASNPGANVYGNVVVDYHSGLIDYIFSGSNEKGNITGSKAVNVDNDGPCDIHIKELYGGSNKAPIDGNVTLTMICPTGGVSAYHKIDKVFGGSRQADIEGTGNVVLNIEGGEYDYVFGGNNLDGTIYGNVTLNLYGGTINEAAFGGNLGGGSILGNITVNVADANNACPLEVKDIFGAGDQAQYIAPTGNGAREHNPIVNINHLRAGKSVTGNVYGGGNGDPTNATQEPGMVTGSPQVVIGDNNGSHRAAIVGNVYGGGNAAKVVGTTAVLMQNGNSTAGNDIYGGGNLADVTGATTVAVNGGTVTRDVYGGGALADVGGSSVTLGGGTVRDLYGGGLGDNTHPALVNGAVQVTVNSGTVRDVFGCNNVNGAPSGSVRVDINGDVTRSVYGGGNQAAASVSPTVYVNKGTVAGSVFGGGLGATAVINGNPVVTIGDLAAGHEGYVAIVSTDVYGGGDLANVNGTTTVLVQKCNTVIGGDVYGGGNAADVDGTSVTIDGGTISGMVFGGGHGNKNANPQTEANVNGNVAVDVTGGTINKVFGGSNSKGNISGTVAVNIDKGATSCPMHINEVYGGGNEAAGNAGTITIGCTGTEANSEGIGDVYGGANAADINSNITLEINGGRINNVFGGNNTSGTISGAIEVNIEKTQNCDWYVGNVYGGGNLAPYTGSPAVNVKNGTVSLNVYGGGKGAGAVVTGNPVVMVGDLTPAHSAYVAAVTGDVYGGGDAAAVTGTTSVTLQKANSTAGRLFGGGNAAGVSSTATVTLTAGTVSTGVYGGCNASGSVGDVTITLTNGQVGTDANHTADVYGGGFGSATTTTGNIGVSLGSTTVYGDLYGGSALGSVNASTSDNTTLTIGGANLHGTIYGGGKGDNSTTATTLGNVIINYNTANAGLAGLYGGANINGNVAGDINVYVDANVGATGNGNSRDIFGGGLGAATTTDGNVTVTVGNSSTPTIYGDLYGGSALGEVGASGKIAKVDFKAGTLNGSIYGGGMGDNSTAAAVSGGTEVAVAAGTVTKSIYGGCNVNGSVTEDITVNVTGGTLGASGNGNEASVYGGGFGHSTSTAGNVTVNINGAQATIWGDVYGGSGFGNVNSDNNDATTVNILNGTVKGNVFGGGLGDKASLGAGHYDYAATEYGTVTVNIGATDGASTPTYSGSATIGGKVYGCNNTNGSPRENVVVNIYQTAHTTSPVDNTYETGAAYAIADVFGGGKNADFSVSGKTATVNVYTCANTIGRVFGGGDAAAVYGSVVNIYGGRFNYVFGGGNGEVVNTQADIGAGGITLNLHGGNIGTLVSGSNQRGTISGPIQVQVDNNSPCSEEVTDFFGGSNQVDIATDVTATIDCGAGVFHNVYGGSNAADITGDVTLNIKGGTMTNVFGGSKGVLSGTAANITGNVTLNLYGGKMVNAFGGSDQNGNITGNIAVNVLDHEGNCKLDVTNIYGAGNVTPYTPDDVTSGVKPNSPTVNVMHVKVVEDDPNTNEDESIPGIRGSVFGGGLGTTAVVTANPVVNIGYTNAMSSLASVEYPDASINRDTYTAIVCGSLYGGGDAAAVTGNPVVTVDNSSSMVKERIIGGGNAASVTGNTHVIVNNGTFGTGSGVSRGVYGGCNTTGTVSGDVVVDILGGTFGTQSAVNNKVSYNIHGGGFGEGTAVTGNVHVTYGSSVDVHSDYPKLYGDLYGGSALGTTNNGSSKTTTVDVLNGSFGFYEEEPDGYPVQYGGNIFGGGLGDADNNKPAKVSGEIHVNIGAPAVGSATEPTGQVSLRHCSVYGCNNSYGSPQQNVYVDVYKTAHTIYDSASYIPTNEQHPAEYAILNVFGGGNRANYAPDEIDSKKVNVSIHTCQNTIENVYGGGNAADVTGTNVVVQGGHYNNIFAGGNGQILPANVTTNGANMIIKSGRVGYYFEGCNMQGAVTGGAHVDAGCTLGVDCPCGDTLRVEHYYFGANMATVFTGLKDTVHCGQKFNYVEVYAGSRLATIYGDIDLTVMGGTIDRLYGGSEGSRFIAANVRRYPQDDADIDNFPEADRAGLRAYLTANPTKYGTGGNIILRLEGGDIGDVYGGNNFRGNVEGTITVIVDSNETCGNLDIDNIYGGSNLAGYTPTGDAANDTTPLVKLIYGHVNFNVYGSSKGGDPTHSYGNGAVTGHPMVIVGTTDAGKHFHIGRDLYGGGSAANVTGNTEVIIKGTTVAGKPTTTIGGNVYGGGKSGDVSGNSSVTILPE